MDIPPVDLNQIRALHALLTERTVTAAARRLSITQAAASNALARLRELFGDPLLTRAGRSMVLTPRAEALIGPVEEVMRSLERVFAPVGPVDPAGMSGVFRIATTDHVDLVLLPRAEALLSAEAPGIDLTLVAYSDAAMEELRAGRVDLVLAPRLADAPDVRSEALFEDRLVCVLRAGHPAAEGPLTLRRYAALEHVLVAPRSLPGGPVDVALAERGLSRRVVRIMPQFTAAMLVVARSDRITTLPERLVRELAGMLSLETRPLPLTIAPFAIHQFWHRRNDADPRHAWLRGLLRRVASSRTSPGSAASRAVTAATHGARRTRGRRASESS